MSTNINFPNDINRAVQDISKSLSIIAKYHKYLLDKNQNELEKRGVVWTEEEREGFRNNNQCVGVEIVCTLI